MKDAKVRHRPAELEAVTTYAVRAYCVTNANLRGVEQAERLVSNLPRIIAIAAQRGPYIYGVYTDRVTRLWPK